MPNNIKAIRPNIVIAKQNLPFIEAGINSTNTNIIFKVGNTPLSYKPGRTINGMTSFEYNGGYWLVANVDMDLSEFLAGPLPKFLGTHTDFTFNVPTASTVSAGVFNEAGQLVRTLWNNQHFEAGDYVGIWDGTDDFLELLPSGRYNIKTLLNRMTYAWEGVMGNTSDQQSGPTVWHSFWGPFFGIAFTDTTGYVAPGYNESAPSAFKFQIGAPNTKQFCAWPQTLSQGETDATFTAVATDGTLVYFAAENLVNRFIIAVDVATESEVNFSAGAPLATQYGRTYIAAIDKTTTGASGSINSIAVQKTGGFLVSARPGTGVVHLINKTTGEILFTNNSFTSPRVAIDANDNLLITHLVTGGYSLISGGSAFGTATNTGNEPAKGFDGDTGTSFFGSAFFNEYCGLQYTDQEVINKVSIYPHPGGTNAIEGKYLQGTNDGLNWTRLFTVPGGLVDGQYNDFTFSNSGGYYLYAFFSDSGSFAFADIKFYGPGSSTSYVLEKMSINPTTGALTSLAAVSGFSNPLAIGANFAGDLVIVADGGSSQQIKAFSGSLVAAWVYGQPGGYANGPAVSNDKFLFRDVNTFSAESSFIAFQPDGTFWVGDTGNSRSQHFAADQTWIERIMNCGRNYGVQMDPNNPARVTSSFLEFTVDYSAPLSLDQWELTYNWSQEIINRGTENFFNIDRLKSVTTFSNGRVYALNKDGGAYEIVELDPAVGLRFTGVILANQFFNLFKDGSIWGINYVFDPGFNPLWTRATVTGFDGSNNPIYSAFAPVVTGPLTVALDPVSGAIESNLKTDSGKIVMFDAGTPAYPVDASKFGYGYHLGAVDIATGEWAFKTSPATFHDYSGPFPKNGAYDIGNNVVHSGGQCHVLGDVIIWNYHGEFWKAVQTNWFNVFHESGLMLGQFGTDRWITPGEAGPAMEGNALTWGGAMHSGKIKVVHGGEGDHGGVHLWTVSGLDTISQQTTSAVFSSTNPPARPATPGKTNLLEGGVLRSFLANGADPDAEGWTKTGANVGRWGYRNADARNPDLQFYTFTPGTHQLKRDIVVPDGSAGWVIDGEIAFPQFDYVFDTGLSFAAMVLRDKAGKVILFFDRHYVTGNLTVKYFVNNHDFLQGAVLDIQAVGRQYRPFKITSNGSGLSFEYAGNVFNSMDVFEAGANRAQPDKFGFEWLVGGTNSGFEISFNSLTLTVL